MKKYAKIISPETKQVMVGIGSNENYYKSSGMTLQEVEQAYDGSYYLKGHAPAAADVDYKEKRLQEYPDIREYLDAQVKINSGNEELVAQGLDQLEYYTKRCLEIKAKYPKL